MSKYTPPFITVPMPLDKCGRGPEMEPSKVSKTIYQVWDAAFQTIAECYDQQAADIVCEALNTIGH